MKPVEVSKTARQEWRKIWYYIAADSVDAAERFSRALKDELLHLAEFPNTGHPRLDCKKTSYRFWRINGYPYLIAYRNLSAKIIIARIIHGARDFRQLFE
jgi:toxin ParE1/3/4